MLYPTDWRGQFAVALAEHIGRDALLEIDTAQLSLQQLKHGHYPSEMEEIVKSQARKTLRRYTKYLDALSRLTEPRLTRSYGPGESPIHLLPSELLSFIFTLAAEIPFMLDVEKRWVPDTLRLVCSHWKRVAEETPTLWRNIDARNGVKWSQRAMEWSKSVSLDVCLRVVSL